MQGGPDDELIALRKRFDLDYLREDIDVHFASRYDDVFRAVFP